MSAPPRTRLDQRLVALGLAPTREKAQALLLAGRVRVAGHASPKAGTRVGEADRIELLAPPHPFVGRGGVKLDAALETFPVAVSGRIALDLGASTGGFTDVLLRRGAARVHAVDVGYGLLDARLSADPRVVLHERTNARTLGPEVIAEPVDLVTADLAFISLRLVLPAVVTLLAPRADLVLLVKPQFELGRGEVGRGVVTDPERRSRAVALVAAAGRALGLRACGVTPSPIAGQKGNRELFLWLAAAGRDLGADLEREIRRAVDAGAAGGPGPA